MWIQVAGRFVGQNDLRSMNERASKCNALLLATRKLTRERSQPVAQPQSSQKVCSCNLRGLLVATPKQVRQGNVLLDIEVWNEVEGLENKSNQTSAQACGRIGFQLVDPDHPIVIPEFDRPGVGAVESSNEMHQRGFADARFTNDRDALTTADLEVDLAQYPTIALPRSGTTVKSADASNDQRTVASWRCRHQSMISAQASSGTATALPTTGTVLTTAAEIRHGAARTLQPERMISRIADTRSGIVLRGGRCGKRVSCILVTFLGRFWRRVGADSAAHRGGETGIDVGDFSGDSTGEIGQQEGGNVAHLFCGDVAA